MPIESPPCAFLGLPDSHRNWINFRGAGHADGTDLTNLTNSAAIDFTPDWSPSGKKIAFASLRADGSDEIFVMNADGSGQTRRTKNTAFDAQPAWSPDGTRIAFVSHRDGDSDVFVMRANGDRQQKRTNNSVEDTDPDWQPIP